MNKIKYDTISGVATLTLNDPTALNALSATMTEDLLAALTRAESDASIRAVLIKGAGEAFCSGGNVYDLKNMIGNTTLTSAALNKVHESIRIMRRMAKPIVAAVHGSCAGFGISLMLAADLVMASDDTKFTLAYSLIGTSPDGGSTFHLTRAVGIKRAMAIALTGNRFSAEDALNWGLVNMSVPFAALEEKSMALASSLANGPTQAYARTKMLLNQAFSSLLDQQLDAESQAFTESVLTEDFAEGVSAFIEKRKPTFKGL